MTSVVALGLALLSTTLKDAHNRNETLYKKRAILSSIDQYLDRPVSSLTDEDIAEIFEENIEQQVVNTKGERISSDEVVEAGYKGGKAEDIEMAKEHKKPEDERILPVFIYRDDGQAIYITSVRGSGLWDAIWGHIALKDDFRTLAGATFDHQAETPGLGAEIKDNPSFSDQFVGKKIYDKDGDFTAVKVMKGGAKNDWNQVDAISGATVTSNGVTAMLKRGIKYYLPYFENLETNKEQ